MALSEEDMRKLADLLHERYAATPHECPLRSDEARERHERHHDYVEIVLQREAERSALRRAVIEKSLGGLVWSAILGLGAAVWSYLKEHLK